MSHRAHPAEGDKADAILFEYCDDCSARARNLGITLDEFNFAAMWRRMLVTEIPRTYQEKYPNEKPGYRSRTEKDLGRQMYYLYILLERRGMYPVITRLGNV